MSNNNFVGYLVSIESKNIFFQGVINSIDTKNSIIQLKNCFQNGINLGAKLIDVKTTEIDNIEILADPIKAASLLKPINENEKSESKSIDQNSGQNNNPINNRNRPKIISPNQYQKNYHNGNNQNSQDCFNSNNEDSLEEDFDFEKNLALFDKDAFYEKMEGHPRQSKNLTFNESTNSLKKNPNEESTFVRYHQISVDNLFSSVSRQNKHSENRNSLSIASNGNPSSKDTGARNYRFDEMILDTGEPINFRQIQLPNKNSNSKNYVTDEGFIVPCIDLALKEALISQSYKYGFNKQRQIECMGRCCAEMCLQLLGGSIRFLPKNNHQKPAILVLANNYSIQGVYALCTSRLLSIRTVKIYLLILKSNEEDSLEFKNELNFLKSNFDSASCIILKDINDLNSIKSIDLILCGLDSFVDESSLLKTKNQANIQSLKKYVQTCKANAISIEPSTEENVLHSKWCLTSVLPMQMPKHSGRVYLCDMGFTKQIFDSVNIKYQSPFGAKFVIPLHDD